MRVNETIIHTRDECAPNRYNIHYIRQPRSFFLVADERLYKRLCPSVCRSVRWSVGEHESKSGKNSVSAPAHPSATGIGRVSGLVLLNSNVSHDHRILPLIFFIPIEFRDV